MAKVDPRRGRMQVYSPRSTPGDTRHVFTRKSAYTIVNALEEGTFPTGYDLYVCNAAITVGSTLINRMAGKPRIVYATPSLVYMGTPGNTWYDGIIAATTGADYWHTDGSADDPTPGTGNRLEETSTQWYTKPSASLGTRLAQYIVANINTYFLGVFHDEAQINVPDSYWTAWKTATDGPTDPERPAYDVLWNSMQVAFQTALKGVWQEEKILIANTAGGTYPTCDGITIEQVHIDLYGDEWAKAQFTKQSQYFDVNPWRYKYATEPLNVAWNSPLQVAGLVMKGLAE